MSQRIPAGIAGTGMSVPDRVMTNRDFESLIDTSDEWIVQRTGIRERRFAADGETTADLSERAARQALETSGVAPEDIDLIVTGTLTPDYLLPSTSCLLQERLGLGNAGAFDVAAACTGFLSALHIGESFIAAGRAQRVLCIGAEVLSRYLDMQDRTSCILFGDGAGAAILTPHAECQQAEILKTTLGADGSGFEFIHMKGGGSAIPPTVESIERGDHFIRLRGREVYRFAVTKMAELMSEMIEGHDPEEISLVVPHQVNARIIQAALERVGWPEDKVIINIDKYGNTSAATVPIALHEALQQERIEKGKLVIFVAFGAGLTWGASLVRW